jgi:endoglycosylceramidase
MGKIQPYQNENLLKMKKYYILLILAITLFQACMKRGTGLDGDLNNTSENAISVSGTRFVDSYGRQVIFSGINKVNKDPKMNYIDSDSIGIFEQFNQWGFNCVRLGVIWDGAEPEPGKYDEKYLDKLEESVNWAAKNGLYVMLDMHQDLYSVAYSDGAPLWATLSENQPHAKGAIWSDSYFMSPAVQKSFDNFWANTPVSDGIGVQEHYARMWQHVAERFAGNKAVLGFDIMNEPFNGTPGVNILPLILQEYAKLYAEETGRILSENEVMSIWSDEERRFEALTRLQDPAKYARVLDVARDLSQQFEKTSLKDMYQRVGDAIRAVDTTHILFLEHAYFGNTGIHSGIEPVKGKDGKNDPLVVYAAHGYDLLVDTKNYDSQSNSRVELIFTRINETSRSMNVPVLVGEWGAFSGNAEGMTASALFITGLFERLGFSNTYWAYHKGIEQNAYFMAAIVRPYPPFIGGVLKSYGFNHETGMFTCSWEETPRVTAPTIIYIPDLESLVRESITLSPGNSNTVIQSIGKGKAGYLIIPVTGDSPTRSVEFKLNKNQASISIENK